MANDPKKIKNIFANNKIKKDKLKILFVIPILGCGGAEVLLGNIALELSKQGHDVKVISLDKPHDSFKNFPNKEAFISITNPEVVKFNIKFSLHKFLHITSDEFKNIVNSFKPDIIHSHLFLAELIARSINTCEAKFFSHAHDNMFQLEPIGYRTTTKRRWFHYVERFWLLKKYKKFNNNFIAISGDTLQFLRRSIPPTLQKNVHLLYNAIDYNSFERKIKEIDINKKLRLISIGSLVPKKNHMFLIEIAKELNALNIEFQIEVLGDGPLYNSILEKINHENLQDRIILKGNVGNIPSYLKQSDIYLHPATYEPFGLVILEAMASGLPIVCLNGKGNISLNVENKTGFMLDLQNPKLFAEKIQFLIKNPDEYKRISEFCIEFSRDYDISNYCKKLVEIYKGN